VSASTCVTADFKIIYFLQMYVAIVEQWSQSGGHIPREIAGIR